MASSNFLLRVLSAVVGLPAAGAAGVLARALGFAALALLAAALALSEYGDLTLGADRAGARAPPGGGGDRLRRRRATSAPSSPCCGRWRRSWCSRWRCCWATRGPAATCPRPSSAWPRRLRRLLCRGPAGGPAADAPRSAPTGSLWVTTAIAVTFVNDTGAYFTGRALGRHKLAPAISPGKTVEGAVGGLVAGVIFMFVARATFFPALSAATPWSSARAGRHPRPGGRPARIDDQAGGWRQGLGPPHPRPRRHPRPHRRRPVRGRLRLRLRRLPSVAPGPPRPPGSPARAPIAAPARPADRDHPSIFRRSSVEDPPSGAALVGFPVVRTTTRTKTTKPPRPVAREASSLTRQAKERVGWAMENSWGRKLFRSGRRSNVRMRTAVRRRCSRHISKRRARLQGDPVSGQSL